MGVGAKNIANAGAKTADINDIYAIFYNPAGLTEIKSGEIAISTQVDADLGYLNFLGIAYNFPIESLNLKIAVAFAYIPRLLMKASGTFREGDFENTFLRFTLPKLSPNFTGDIDSKTDEYRFALAIAPLHNSLWSVGFSVGQINCASSFAGVTLEDPTNFTYITTVAKSTALGFGAKIYPTENITFGANLKNIDSKLDVKIYTVDDNGVRNETYEVNFPYDFTTGISIKYNDFLDLAADYQKIFGDYSGSPVDFQFIRLGSTLKSQNMSYHLGLIAPISIDDGSGSNQELPVPLLPTAGLGWHNEYVDLSIAFYIHPIMSLNEGKASPSADISMSYIF
ncbi:hypothetical protein MNB_SM-4-988 [hydrothermal vent metagenome]|uniref:Uncharacterized protein n=1 Tax=hydrothermal vent metagenome TaxID=652676 RepID=A0A1W1CEC6_9ZZZZ